jgi:hypothetical protein
MKGVPLRGKLAVIALTAVVAIVGAGATGYYVLAHAAPGRYALSGTPTSPKPAPSATMTAEQQRLADVCFRAGPPEARPRCMAQGDAYKSACQLNKPKASQPPAGLWITRSGSEAGFRLHEFFLGLQAPNEAVARTEQVAGGVVVARTAGVLTVTQACIGVSSLTVQSVDRVPAMDDTHGRDPIIVDILEGLDHPYAVFNAHDVTLPSNAMDGGRHRFDLPGELTIKGVTRPAIATLEAIAGDRNIEAVGTIPIVLSDFAMSLPENPMATIDPTATLEAHLFLERS